MEFAGKVLADLRRKVRPGTVFILAGADFFVLCRYGVQGAVYLCHGYAVGHVSGGSIVQILPQVIVAFLRNFHFQGGLLFVCGHGNVLQHNAGVAAVAEGQRPVCQGGAHIRRADGAAGLAGAVVLVGQVGVAHIQYLVAGVARLAGLGPEHINARVAPQVGQPVHIQVHPVNDHPGAADAAVQGVLLRVVNGGLFAVFYHKDFMVV